MSTAMPLSHDLLASLGEFVGTTMFLFLSFGGAKTALHARSYSAIEYPPVGAHIDNQVSKSAASS